MYNFAKDFEHAIRILVIALPLISCVTLGKLLNLSVAHFPHLQNGDDDINYPQIIISIK